MTISATLLRAAIGATRGGRLAASSWTALARATNDIAPTATATASDLRVRPATGSDVRAPLVEELGIAPRATLSPVAAQQAATGAKSVRVVN
jgi:hypothetical protein